MNASLSKPSQPKAPKNPAARRSLAFWARWLHLYLSVLGFATLLFFSITGITLNHADFFESGHEIEREAELTIDPALVPSDAATKADRLGLVEFLRAEAHLRGAVAEFNEEEDTVSVVFKGPAYSANVTVDRFEGIAKIYELKLGTWALLDDLHKGRDSGKAWSWVIDVSAGVLILAALTGLWLLLYIKKRRNPGLVVTVLGTLVLIAVWAVWVP